MKHLFKPELFRWIMAGLMILLIIKLAWLIIVLIWLPSGSLEQIKKEEPKALYYRVRLAPGEIANGVAQPKPSLPKPQGTISDIQLLAIYNASDRTVVTVVYQNKSKVLSRGEAINGFVLEGAGSSFAIFSKENKTYQVPLIKSKSASNSIGKISSASASLDANSPVSAAPKGDIVDAGDYKIVDKSLIGHYAKNIDDIYKNIGITEVKKGNLLQGFRVTFVRKGSPFEKLGIQKGDVIKSVNGQELNSYNAAFDIYKNIQDINNLTLVIERGNKEMELEYEVN